MQAHRSLASSLRIASFAGVTKLGNPQLLAYAVKLGGSASLPKVEAFRRPACILYRVRASVHASLCGCKAG